MPPKFTNRGPGRGSPASWLRRVFRRDPRAAGGAERAQLEELIEDARARYESGDLGGARNALQRVLERDPQRAGALHLLGRVASREHSGDEAIELFRQAAAVKPDSPEIQYDLGTALQSAGRQNEALTEFRTGLSLNPRHARMRNDLATALMELGRLEEAQVELERLKNEAPGMPEVFSNLGTVQGRLGRLEEAISEYRRALDLMPQHADAHSNLLLTLNYSASCSRDDLFAEHRRFGERHVQPVAAPPADSTWPRRLRLGYVSPDFRSHVVSCVMLPIIEKHNRDRFEVFCYYTYPVADEVSARIRELADHWTDCADLTDAELADRIRCDRIDILVDLAGHTAHQRLTAFALKPAPVQVSYLGYPNTTGLRAIEWRITDAKADPPGDADRYHVEQLVRLPRTFLCYRPGPDIHAVGSPPATGADRVTFGCFNNYLKLSPPFYDAAARILAAVPDSRLLLKAKPLGAQAAARQVLERFSKAGIGGERLVLRGWEASVEDHLAAYHSVDIALDSFPYNGTTTTLEALWMGVPVVALEGDRHVARVGSSLLQTMGLGDLIAHDLDGYVRIAAGLAGDLPRLAELRGGMRERMRRSALMDERGFVDELESCLVWIWQDKLKRTAAGRAGDVPPGLLEKARALRASGHLMEAKNVCIDVLAREADMEEAVTLLWDLCYDTSAPAEAVEWIGLALSANPGAARYHYMLGCALQDLGRTGEAVAAFRKALGLDPAFAKAANNLGCLLEAAGDLEEAARCYENALRVDPDLANALYNRGNVHKQRGEWERAQADMRRALAIEPQHADWHGSLGDVLLVHWKLDEAVASYQAALAIDPTFLMARFGLGNALMALARTEQAEAHMRRVLDERPDFAEAHSNLLLCLHYRKGDDPRAMYEEHLEWARRHSHGLAPSVSHLDVDRTPTRKLNIGYLSPNFHSHAVAWSIEPVLASHDRSAFRVFFYSTVVYPDAVTQRFMKLCDEWRDIHRLSGDDAARLVREDRIDILVDLAGHTGGGRPLVFARKPAPVQVTWQGYPNTTGLAAMDYRITDADADPEGEPDRHHTERLVRLDTGFLCYAPPADAPAAGEPPLLKSGRVTFGSFNNFAKVTPETIGLWAKLLSASPQARLLMKAHALGSESARRTLREQFASHGVAAHRIEILGPEDSHARHLGRYREVDIGLDPFPYHGTATTYEALWMGVPVVTLAGRTHVSRVGVSILRRVGLTELVAANPEEYVRKALELAGDTNRLRELRAGLRERMRASPLLDAARFARGLESAYRDMWLKWCRSGSAATASNATPIPGQEMPGELLRLHIGGRQIKDGWKILDAQPGPGVDYTGNCADLSQFADGTVHEIFASDALLRLGHPQQLSRAFCEFHRVLRAGGLAMIRVPRSEALSHEFLAARLFAAGFSRVEKAKRFALFDDGGSPEDPGTEGSLNVVAFK